MSQIEQLAASRVFVNKAHAISLAVARYRPTRYENSSPALHSDGARLDLAATSDGMGAQRRGDSVDAARRRTRGRRQTAYDGARDNAFFPLSRAHLDRHRDVETLIWWTQRSNSRIVKRLATDAEPSIAESSV